MAPLHYEITFKYQNVHILRNDNKHLSKSMKSFFHWERDVIYLRDDVITPIYFFIKNLWTDQERQPDIICFTSSIKKVHRVGRGRDNLLEIIGL